MDMSKLTQKSQQALQEAQSIAGRFDHTETDGEHLLLALIEQPEGLVPRLLAQTGADVDALRAAVDAELGRRPKVTGPGASPGQVALAWLLQRSPTSVVIPGTSSLAHLR